MDYLSLLLALVIVILFGFWSGRQHPKFDKKQKPKKGSIHSGPRRLTKLRRVK